MGSPCLGRPGPDRSQSCESWSPRSNRYRTITKRLCKHHAVLPPISHGVARSEDRKPTDKPRGSIMIRTAFKCATAIAGFVLLGSSVVHADPFGPSVDRRHGH